MTQEPRLCKRETCVDEHGQRTMFVPDHHRQEYCSMDCAQRPQSDTFTMKRWRGFARVLKEHGIVWG
jgi:hypothetical protein